MLTPIFGSQKCQLMGHYTGQKMWLDIFLSWMSVNISKWFFCADSSVIWKNIDFFFPNNNDMNYILFVLECVLNYPTERNTNENTSTDEFSFRPQMYAIHQQHNEWNDWQITIYAWCPLTLNHISSILFSLSHSDDWKIQSRHLCHV